MRFMIITRANSGSEAGVTPGEELLDAMGKYNRELARAGILLDGSGLQPSAKGARIRYRGKRTTVIDGPFSESKELIAGYAVIEVKSKDEAIEWARRMPNPHGSDAETEIEIRQLFELDDFGPSEAVEEHFRGLEFARPK